MNDNQNEYIVIGEVMGAHGQNGALRVRVLTEFPERFQCGAQFYIEGHSYTITATQPSRETVILKLTGVDSLEVAGQLRGKHLEIPASARKTLPNGRYYHHDIIGLEVVTNTGQPLGWISEILSTGSNDIYVANNCGREILVPAVKDVVKEIDITRKRITIEIIEGLLA